MVQKKAKNKEPEKLIDVTTSDVFVVNANRYRPYIETFVHNPVNFTQQKMGTFLGLFYITDFSEDSAHIVNFLTSEAKKEYFANTKRTVNTSLESALHRVNCALAEIAKHGNVGWLGKIDGAVCVIDEATVHFSVTGDARVLLLRENALSDISDGLASDEALEHPLKTFVDIASGDLEKDDIIIITTPELLSLFSIEDLAKYASRFGADEFVRFLNTALINECDVAAAFVLHAKEITQKQAAQATTPTDAKSSEELSANFFSEKTYEKDITSPVAHAHITQELEENVGDEYTDKRTGHIYVDGDEYAPVEQSALSPALGKAQDFYDDFRYGTKSRMRSWMQSSKKFLSGIGSTVATTVRDTARSIGGQEGNDAATIQQHAEKSDTLRALREEARTQSSTTAAPQQKPDASKKKTVQEIPVAQNPQQHPKSDAIKDFFATTGESTKVVAGEGGEIIARVSAAIKNSSARAVRGARALIHTITTRVRKIPALQDRRVLIIIGVLILLVLPLLLRPLFSDKEEAQQVQEEVVTEEVAAPTITATIGDARALVSEDDVLRHVAVVDDETVLGISGETIWITTIASGESETFTLPDSETIAHTTFMDELNLLFLYTKTAKLYAFSTVDKKFTHGTPSDLPKNASAIASFSTFLYVLDPDTNQLYRYPRAESTTGFGARVAWFGDGEAPNTKNFHTMGINENVYLASDEDLVAYLRGEKIDASFSLGENFIDLLYTNENSENVAILNKEKAQITRLTKTGQSVDDFIHPDFAQALSFAIDEEQNKLYLVTDKGLSVFDL